MTATSMASCVSAPAIGVSHPRAAAIMARNERVMPPAMLWNAMA
jgi:hypothetical protein